MIAEDYLPCYDCLDLDRLTSTDEPGDQDWQEDETCATCKGSRRLPKNNVWSLLLTLIDLKISQLVSEPLRQQVLGSHVDEKRTELASAFDFQPPPKQPGSACGVLPPGLNLGDVTLLSQQTNLFRDCNSFNSDLFSKKETRCLPMAVRETEYRRGIIEYKLVFCAAATEGARVDVRLELQVRRKGLPAEIFLRGSLAGEAPRGEPIHGPLAFDVSDSAKAAFSLTIPGDSGSARPPSLVFELVAWDDAERQLWVSSPFSVKAKGVRI